MQKYSEDVVDSLCSLTYLDGYVRLTQFVNLCFLYMSSILFLLLLGVF